MGISSVSGVGPNDAAAYLTQQHDEVALEVRWAEGSSISVSATAANCEFEGSDFEAGYSLSTSKWRNDEQVTRPRVEADMRAWLHQIEFLCSKPGIAKKFKFAKFSRAFKAFTGSVW
ncbi:hypothetical protein J3454_02370 [Erythrobacter sp. NFXS35]|uniref:hypothetical protein n=1 Tax=Erythrobacter sp. NFXS35 TaxID=2818436 RepID=UPI0032DE4981